MLLSGFILFIPLSTRLATLYLNILFDSANLERVDPPILIIVEIVTTRNDLVSTVDAKVDFRVTNPSIVGKLEEYFTEFYVWRLSRGAKINSKCSFDCCLHKLKPIFNKIQFGQDTNPYLTRRDLWLSELERFLNPIDIGLRPAHMNIILILTRQAKEHFLHRYDQRSIRSVDYFCFCRSLTIDFLAHALAVQCFQNRITVEQEAILVLIECVLHTLFSDLRQLQPCGAVYKGIGHAKDGCSVYCYQARIVHVKHLTAMRVYGLSTINRILNRAQTDRWTGDFVSSCNQTPTPDEKNRMIHLTRDYTLKLRNRKEDENLCYTSLLSLLRQSNIHLEHSINLPHNYKFRFHCICCLIFGLVNDHGVCCKCIIILSEYSKTISELSLPVIHTNSFMTDVCSICVTDQRDHCILPCGHRAYCGLCAERIVRIFRLCPICRQCAKEKMRIIEI